jgi:hypothetical protein
MTGGEAAAKTVRADPPLALAAARIGPALGIRRAPRAILKPGLYKTPYLRLSELWESNYRLICGIGSGGEMGLRLGRSQSRF